MLVFLLSRDILEQEHPEDREPIQGRSSTEQVWALDVKLAAIWIRDGAQVLWDMDCGPELQEYWGDAMAEKTELWPRDDGLTRERWEMWLTRLRALSVAPLEKETRTIVVQAVKVMEDLLDV